jgi:hypothetical protein
MEIENIKSLIKCFRFIGMHMVHLFTKLSNCATLCEVRICSFVDGYNNDTIAF